MLHITTVLSSQTSTITTPPPTVPPAAPVPILVSASTQVVLDNDPLEEFFQYSITDLLHLLWRCVSMFLEGRHCIELGRPMLLNFLNNVKNIGACKRAAPY